MEQAVLQAVRDVQFLFRLHQEANAKLYDDQRAYRTLTGLLASQLQGLLLCQDLARAVGHAAACVGRDATQPTARVTGATRATRGGHRATPEALEADGTVSADMGKWMQWVEEFLKEELAKWGALLLQPGFACREPEKFHPVG